MATDFDARQATLHYAEEAKRSAATSSSLALQAATASAIACGLVYVGDQVKRLVERGDGALELRYGDALRAIAEHHEEFGSPPPDEMMRAIANHALGGVR